MMMLGMLVKRNSDFSKLLQQAAELLQVFTSKTSVLPPVCPVYLASEPRFPFKVARAQCGKEIRLHILNVAQARWSAEDPVQ